MKIKIGLLMVVFLVAMTSVNAQDKTETDSELIGLAGDNLDLYATLDLFQMSKTIEEFEASLNEEKTGVNNLDLNVDGEVDFIKVVTQQDGEDFAFVLQVDINKDEIQDVAVILVTKQKDGKINIQMKGDEDLYGKDYVIEPKLETSAVTANPAYSGADTVVVKSQAATVVIVESEPIVQYVYSPVYVPYYPPYYYGYYPPYYHPYPVISINIYFGRNRHHHNHYHGGNRGGNTVIINNNNNTYNKTRNTSNTVNRNKSDGKYKQNNASNRPSTGVSKDTKKNNNKAVPDSKKNGTKSNVKENKTSVPSNKSNVKPASKPANKQTTRPASKPANKPATMPANKPSRKSKGGGKRK